MKVKVFYDILFLMRRFKHTLQVEKKWAISRWENQVDQINPVSSSNPDNACLLRPWPPDQLSLRLNQVLRISDESTEQRK